MKNNLVIGTVIFIVASILFVAGSNIQTANTVKGLSDLDDTSPIPWTHLSSQNGDIDPPSLSTQQTASLIFDINQDGLNDFVIAARRDPGPSLVWYQKIPDGWSRFIIDDQVLPIEAGGEFYDIDADGDPDIVMEGDAASAEVWWWENPYPN